MQELEKVTIIRQPFKWSLFIAFVAVCMGSLPLVWVFSNPIGEESRVAFGIAVVVPFVVFLYTRYKNIFRFSEGKLSYKNRFFIKQIINALDVKKVELHRTFRNYSMEVSLSDGRKHYLDIKGLGHTQHFEIVYLLKKANTSIVLEPELEKIVETFSDKEKATRTINELEKKESNNALKQIGYAFLFVVAILLYKLSTGESYTFKELVDTFVNFLH